MKREEFEKRMAGIFDLATYVDSQGDIRYSDSHTQAAWDGCLLVMELFEPKPSARQGADLRAMFEETNMGRFPRRSFERDKFGDYVDRSAEFAWKSLLSTLGHAERLQALERLRLRIDAHMFIREDGELLGYGVTVPEMREFRELLIPFNGEIKIK